MYCGPRVLSLTGGSCLCAGDTSVQSLERHSRLGDLSSGGRSSRGRPRDLFCVRTSTSSRRWGGDDEPLCSLLSARPPCGPCQGRQFPVHLRGVRRVGRDTEVGVTLGGRTGHERCPPVNSGLGATRGTDGCV